jgi:N-methylhydantoinase A
VVGELSKPSLPRLGRGDLPRAAARPVYFTDEGFMNTAVFQRTELRAGNQLAGPALIEEYGSTTVVPPRARLEVDEYGNLLIEVYGD